jgi:hypothetical protein
MPILADTSSIVRKAWEGYVAEHGDVQDLVALVLMPRGVKIAPRTVFLAEMPPAFLGHQVAGIVAVPAGQDCLWLITVTPPAKVRVERMGRIPVQA